MPFPSANDKTKSVSALAVEALKNNSTGSGTLAIATAVGREHCYLAFSPLVQAGFADIDKVAGFISKIDKPFVICTEVSDSIARASPENLGCAEKKIITAFVKLGYVMDSICVRPFPNINEFGSTVSHGRGVDSYGLLLNPCESCESASSGLPQPRPASASSSSSASTSSPLAGFSFAKIVSLTPEEMAKIKYNAAFPALGSKSPNAP